jgi:hypothetical protein
MKHNLIKTDNYLLIVDDDSEIKIGDRVIENTINQIFEINDINKSIGLCRSKVDTYVIDSCRKIISHAPLNGSPYLDGMDVLPLMDNGEDAEQLAKLKYPIIMSPNGRNLAGGHYDIDVNFSERSAYKHGYNKAREKYKYTEEDARLLIMCSFLKGVDRGHYSTEIEDRIIQSLQHHPKHPIAFECEVEPKFKHIGSTKEVKGSGSRIKNKHAGNPKTITNSEGRTEWVGKYIYE